MIAINVTNASGSTTISRKPRRMVIDKGYSKANVSIAGKNVNVYRFGKADSFVTVAGLTARQLAKISKKTAKKKGK